MPASPPRRPQLLPHTPVLLRGVDEVQVGLDPGRAVLLRGPGPLLLLARLDGLTGHDDLHACARETGLSPAQIDGVLRSLDQAGWLRDADAEPAPPPRRQVRLAGLGRLGQQVAALLLEAGVDVHAADLDRPGHRPVLPGLEPAGGATPARGRLTTVNHWSKPDLADLDLTVVAADTAEVDRVVTDHLLRRDEPHLLLRSGGSTVTVGPLVVPGRTACVRCTDLGRRDTDRAWPQLLPQLVRLRLPTSPVLTAWAASVGAAQVVAFVGGSWPESAGATLELSARDHLMRWRAWPVHPACGCAWSGTTEWGP